MRNVYFENYIISNTKNDAVFTKIIFEALERLQK